jgi:hypothetical protein
MERGAAVSVVFGLVVVAAAVAFFAVRFSRLRAKRALSDLLARYFNGDLPLDQLVRRAQEVASRRFTGSPECQALVQAAFQRSAEAKLTDKAHSLEIEKKLLTALADVRSEFGLPERYQSEGWKAGRE